MKEIAVLDTSFLVNIKLLNILKYLCEVFKEIIMSPEVWNESYQFHSELENLACIKIVRLENEEIDKVNQLHDEFVQNYPGKHKGEIEALVLSQSRGYSFVVSDNFAPWYIRKHHDEYSKVNIFRGTYFIARLIEIGVLEVDFTEQLKGIYSIKDISRIRKRYSNHE